MKEHARVAVTGTAMGRGTVMEELVLGLLWGVEVKGG